jgi:hypothetical protein
MYPTLQREYPAAWGAGDRTGLAGLGAEQGCILPRGSATARLYGGGVSVVSELTTDTIADLGAGEVH